MPKLPQTHKQVEAAEDKLATKLPTGPRKAFARVQKQERKLEQGKRK